MGWPCLCRLIRPLKDGAQGFIFMSPFGFWWNECLAVTYCLSGLGLEGLVGSFVVAWKSCASINSVILYSHCFVWIITKVFPLSARVIMASLSLSLVLCCAVCSLDLRISARRGEKLFRPSLPYYPFSYLRPEACIPRTLLLERLNTLCFGCPISWRGQNYVQDRLQNLVSVYSQAQPKVSMLALCELSCVAGSLLRAV